MNQPRRSRTGFTLVEVLIVVVIMAILAATIIPQFSDSSRDAKVNTAKFNLHTLRAQIELYKSQHDGLRPSNTLAELTSSTNAQGTVGTGAQFPYGPYLQAIPVNPLTNSRTIRVVTTDSPTASGESDAGWLYNANSGRIWIDHADYIAE
jgi:general secretion pathway protein G